MGVRWKFKHLTRITCSLSKRWTSHFVRAVTHLIRYRGIKKRSQINGWSGEREKYSSWDDVENDMLQDPSINLHHRFANYSTCTGFNSFGFWRLVEKQWKLQNYSKTSLPLSLLRSCHPNVIEVFELCLQIVICIIDLNKRMAGMKQQ